MQWNYIEKSLLFFLLLIFTKMAQANALSEYECLVQDMSGSPSEKAQYISVLSQASAIFGVPPEVLVAIKRVESSLSLNSGVINRNRDGSSDHGLHQVNFRVWQPVVEELGVSLSRDQFHDIYNNTLMAAWIVRRKLERFDGDVFAAVGHYHRGGGRDATSNAIRREYMNKFIPQLREIVSRCY